MQARLLRALSAGGIKAGRHNLRELPRILVTGVGGGVGQSIIKSLSDTDWPVIAADGNDLAVGLYASEHAYRVPYARDSRYIEVLHEVCRKERINYVFPGLDAELPVLARAVDTFRDIGVTIVVSRPEVVDLCDDKLGTIQFLANNELPFLRTIPAVDAQHWDGGYPVVLKPRIGGCRSVGVHVAKNATEVGRILEEGDPALFVMQEYVEGDEYTCGTVNFEGLCKGIIVMRRILRFGDTYQAFVVRDDQIEAVVRSTAERLKPFGPCNFQLRLRDGCPYIFEINARCSGTTAARSLAGFNEPRMTVEYLYSGRNPSFEVREISILRYWNELVVQNEELRAMCTAGYRNGLRRKL